MPRLSNFKRYQKLGHGAVDAWNKGQHRESADKYLKAFQMAPSKDEMMRWQIFSGYTSILREDYFQASQSDMDALKQVAEDAKEMKAYRCEAFFTLGLLHWDINDRDVAAHYYRECVRVGTKAKGLDRKMNLISTIVSSDGTTPNVGVQPAGNIINDCMKEATKNLEHMERPNIFHGPGYKPTFRRSDGTVADNHVRSTFFAMGPNLTNFTRELGDRLTTVGGETCDVCQRTAHEAGIKRLLCCIRCTKAYYCGKDCQKKAWKAGHKECCRGPGEFKPGDYVRLHSIENKKELNGILVEVVRSIANREGRWEVKIPGGDRTLSVSHEKMEHLRPLK